MKYRSLVTCLLCQNVCYLDYLWLLSFAEFEEITYHHTVYGRLNKITWSGTWKYLRDKKLTILDLRSRVERVYSFPNSSSSEQLLICFRHFIAIPIKTFPNLYLRVKAEITYIILEING